MNPNCSFCKQPIEDGETIAVCGKAILRIYATGVELTHQPHTQSMSHEDCWEGRNRPFPARRRVIQIRGIPDE